MKDLSFEHNHSSLGHILKKLFTNIMKGYLLPKEKNEKSRNFLKDPGG